MDEDDVAAFFHDYASDADCGSDLEEPELSITAESLILNTKTPESNLINAISHCKSQSSIVISKKTTLPTTTTTPTTTASASTTTSAATGASNLTMSLTDNPLAAVPPTPVNLPAPLPVVGPIKPATTSSYCKNLIEPVVHQPDLTEPAMVVFCLCKAQCYRQFKQHDLVMNILNCAELATPDLDLVLVAKLQAFTRHGETTVRTKQRNEDRKQIKAMYYHKGLQVCRELFLQIHGVGRTRLHNLQLHAINEGLVVRQKKSGGRKSTAISYKQHVDIHSFLINFAEEHGIKLPGRIPGKQINNYF